MNQRITVLGAGSSGMATAAWLTRQGWQVTLWDVPGQSVDFETIQQQGGIQIEGGAGYNGLIMPHRLTTDLEEALADTEQIIVCTSAARHPEIAELCAPLAREGQVFLLAPGNFGSFMLRAALDKLGKAGVVTAETCGGPWACRRIGPGQVLVASPLKAAIKAAALPAGDNEKLIRQFEGILPLEAGANVLEVSLNSPNVITHVGGTVLNAGAVDRNGDSFAFFLDGLSESVIRCFSRLEEERNGLLERLGLRVYNPSSESFMRTLLDYDSHRELDTFRSLDGPSSFTHRYVSEDAACGVAMLVSLGRQYQVPMPLTEAFLTVVQTINGTDYLATGRTLEGLDIAKPTIEQLMKSL